MAAVGIGNAAPYHTDRRNPARKITNDINSVSHGPIVSGRVTESADHLVGMPERPTARIDDAIRAPSASERAVWYGDQVRNTPHLRLGLGSVPSKVSNTRRRRLWPLLVSRTACAVTMSSRQPMQLFLDGWLPGPRSLETPSG